MQNLIDGQAAIDIVTRYEHKLNVYIGTPNDSEVYAYARGLLLSIRRNIDALPSAEPEIVRCKDCKHIRRWRSEEAAQKFGQAYECARGVFLAPHADDFCSKAERQKDDE